MKKELTPFLKKVIKAQLRQPLRLCPTFQAWCRFAVEGWCLENYQRWGCEFMKVKVDGLATFKERRRD